MRYNNNGACNNTTACLRCHAMVNNKQLKFSNSMTVVLISATVHGHWTALNMQIIPKLLLNDKGVTLREAIVKFCKLNKRTV